MKKPLSELIDKLNRIPEYLSEFMPGEVETTAKDFIALRVTQIRREGLKFRYSNNPGVPAYLYKGKNSTYPNIINQAGRAFIDKKIKEGQKAKKSKFKGFVSFGSSNAGLVNWKQIRQAQGFQVDEVDLSYTNQMLNSVAVIGKESSRTRYRARISAIGTKNRAKFTGNYKRYGDFFQPDQKTKDILGKASAKRTGVFLNSKLGGIATVTSG